MIKLEDDAVSSSLSGDGTI